MIPKNINLFGFSLSRTTILIAIALLVFVVFKIFNLISSFFDSLMIKMGIKKATDLSDMNDHEKNIDALNKSIAKNPDVQFQMNEGNRKKAENIHRILNSFIIDSDELLAVLKTITGPNQRAAIWAIYGQRSLFSRFGIKGDLYENTKYPLLFWQWNKVKPHLDLFLKTY